MKYYIILFLFLTSCSTYKQISVLPEPEKPKLSHIHWSDINISGTHYYSLSDSDMDILNNNLIDILEYEREQQLLIKYYESYQK